MIESDSTCVKFTCNFGHAVLIFLLEKKSTNVYFLIWFISEKIDRITGLQITITDPAIQYRSGGNKMQLKSGALLKICLSKSEALYFKVVKVEVTALAVRQICTVRDGKLKKERKDAPCSYIYRSEVGGHYQEVDQREIDWLREKYKAGD